MTRWNIDEMLRKMCDSSASDLILSAGAPPQMRVNGVLTPLGSAPLGANATRELAMALLTEPQRKILDERKSIDLSKGVEALSRFRINIYHQRSSIALAIRAIPFVIPSFQELGLPDIVRDFADRPNGLILITGPAGSGKSTTLAAMVDHINRTRHMHVVCLEDPIEYLHADNRSVIDQREIGQDALSFGDALRSVFRQSPDVIMIGEMRDLETIQLAVTLAETGHLILATLHTQDTTHAVNRIVDIFPADQQAQVCVQLSLVLVGVVSQQLLLTRDQSRRVLACEVMNVNNAIRNLIREMQPQQIYSVVETGTSQGMVTMNESLYRLCAAGLIETGMALQRSPRPKDLARRLASQAA